MSPLPDPEVDAFVNSLAANTPFTYEQEMHVRNGDQILGAVYWQICMNEPRTVARLLKWRRMYPIQPRSVLLEQTCRRSNRRFKPTAKYVAYTAKLKQRYK